MVCFMILKNSFGSAMCEPSPERKEAVIQVWWERKGRALIVAGAAG